MNTTDWVAVYGAILSTLAIGWNIFNNLEDRPKIQIKTSFGAFFGTEGASEPFFFVEAVNTGKRSAYLSSLGLRSGKEDLLHIKTVSLPCELKPGESHNEWFEIKSLEGRKFDFAWYKDKTGKMYKSKFIGKKIENYFNSKNSKGVEKENGR